MQKTLVILIGLIIINFTTAPKFRRYIKAVGTTGYYKILMTLGTCKEIKLYSENKIWGKVTINRILDIYYTSSIVEYKISMVEVTLVINHSDLLAFSEHGLGQTDFSASVYLPSNTVVIFYSLKIYTCNHPVLEKTVTAGDESFGFFDGSLH